jgi:phosphoglycolate phosphatase-like HAD superfamily hydrolase
LIIVFDLDGTLLNSNTLKSVIIKNFIEKHFGEKSFNETYDIRKTRFELLNELVPKDHDLRQLLLYKLTNELDEAVSNASIYENTKYVLGKLRITVDAMYLSTNTPQSSLRALLKKNRLLEYFDEYFGAPNTKLATIKLLRNRYPSSKILVVGDGIDDLESALSVNAKFIAINAARTNKDLYPPIKIADLEQLISDV